MTVTVTVTVTVRVTVTVTVTDGDSDSDKREINVLSGISLQFVDCVGSAVSRSLWIVLVVLCHTVCGLCW